MRFEILTGSDLERHLPALARVRLRVFREFPYLYDGTAEYEETYLRRYTSSPRAMVALVLDGEAVVGASTALPLADEVEEFQRPFAAAGLPVEDFLYFGESVLLPEYRGQGWGHRFFDAREGHARSLGLPATCFCAVERRADHPARPPGYRSLEPFWESRGYRRRPDLATEFPWQEIGEDGESAKPMVFWVRRFEG